MKYLMLAIALALPAITQAAAPAAPAVEAPSFDIFGIRPAESQPAETVKRLEIQIRFFERSTGPVGSEHCCSNCPCPHCPCNDHDCQPAPAPKPKPDVVKPDPVKPDKVKPAPVKPSKPTTRPTAPRPPAPAVLIARPTSQPAYRYQCSGGQCRMVRR